MKFRRKGNWLLILLVAVSFRSFSQDTSSTTIPNVNLRAAVKLIERLRLDSMIMSRDVLVETKKVADRDEIIRQLNGRIGTFQLLAGNYDQQLKNQEKQMAVFQGLSKSLQKQVKKERVKTWTVGIIGVIATVAASIYIK